ncbi:unnamed protein product [Phytophthora lilii]|uniref:Unnamed protein product n=1 Tax=Phytophthora lilii TaxID=2077276 RepID=A0A9W6WN91_9STRA|nr:unnamed protein product [Phytophthora lilii]
MQAQDTHLPADWTQEIMETLLFGRPHDSPELQEELCHRRLMEILVANDIRKSKHRAVQRRFVERKKEQINRAKMEVQKLQKEYNMLHIKSEKKQLKKENEALQADVDKCEPLPYPTQEQIDLMLTDQL